VLQTYVNALADETLPIKIFVFNPLEPIAEQLDAASVDPKTLAALVIQQPAYFGSVHDVKTITSVAKSMGALTIVSVDPVTLALLEPPGKLGADIVCGDIQPFGNSLNYGGPYGGFIATTQKWTRQLPGRLVGRSIDKEGTTAYTLTLQTREQHIRREKATSNICTNQSLNVLKACIYLALVGPQGLKQVAMLSAQRAHFLANALTQVTGVSLKSSAPFLYEFSLNLPIPAQVLIDEMGERHGIIPGIRLSKYWPEDIHGLLVTVTEMNSQETLIRYIDGFTAIIQSKQGLYETQSAQSTDIAGKGGSSTATSVMSQEPVLQAN
jgi:glycine dehydrogenase subunit 1